jgi:hypothetical protein
MRALAALDAPRVLFRLRCANAHPWIAYGPDENTHWGPVKCVKCASPWIDAAKIDDLAGFPERRYKVPIAADGNVPAQEQEIWADRYEQREGAVVFLTGAHVVARFRRSLGEPIEICQRVAAAPLRGAAMSA